MMPSPPSSAPQAVASPPALSAPVSTRTLEWPDLGPRAIAEQLTLEEAARHRAIDAVLESLEEATRADIEQCALEQLAPFARENLSRVGARSAISVS